MGILIIQVINYQAGTIIPVYSLNDSGSTENHSSFNTGYIQFKTCFSWCSV